MENILTERDDTLDFMRAFAILCVLVAHTSTCCASTTLETWIGEWFCRFVCRCIPIFVFLAGYLFKTKNLERSYLQRKIKRVIVPYLVFSVIALVFQYKAGVLEYIVTHPFELLTNFFWCDTIGIYYFVFVIIYLYTLAFVALKLLPGKRSLLVFTAVLLLVHLLHGMYSLDLVNYYQLEDSAFFGIYFPYRLFLIWPFWFFAGIVFRMYGVGEILRRNKPVVIGALLLVFAFCNYLYFSGKLPPIYNSVPGTLFSITSIAALWLVRWRSEWALYLSQQSYYLYLCHIFFVLLFRDITHHYQLQLPFIFTPVVFAVVLAGPLLLLVGLRKVFQGKTSLLFGAG